MSEIAEFTRHLGHYLPPPDVALVERAFAFSEHAHQGQFRKSGEPYITHPLAVASILSQWRLDAQGLAAALLHDVMEDTKVTKTEIETSFGKPVADMVDGVSKLDQIEFQSREDAQAENFRKMLLAMAQDVRVILIKLADRLHNMRTLDAMAPTHRKRIARETLDIYAPIANRLGLNALYLELQELSFKNLYPMRYRVLAKQIKAARGNRREVMNRILQSIRDGLKQAGIAATVSGREKTVYSVYKKMREKHYTFSQVFDIYGVRILVKDVTACYAALGVLHGLYKPIPGKFKDYVAIPKANGYQSLHTTLFGPFGTPLEAQIRTQDMHRIAEAGVAAHWLYKTGDQLDIAEAQQQTHRWLQSLLEIGSESRDSKEFLEHIKGDLFPDAIYVFTPKGKIMALPNGATAVDFAYAVHTDIGHHCTAARINYELMPLRTELKNGDQVEITTSPTARPNPSWLNFVATGKARSRIRHFLKSLQQRESAVAGRTHARAGPGVAQGSGGDDHLGTLGGAGARIRRKRASRHPGRHRPGQATVLRGRAGAHPRGEPCRRRTGSRIPPSQARCSCAASKASPSSMASAAVRFPATRSSASSAAGRVCWCTRAIAIRCARAASTPTRSSMSSGRPMRKECSKRACGCWYPINAACSRSSRPRSPTRARTSLTYPWSAPTRAPYSTCSSASRCAIASISPT